MFRSTLAGLGLPQKKASARGPLVSLAAMSCDLEVPTQLDLEEQLPESPSLIDEATRRLEERMLVGYNRGYKNDPFAAEPETKPKPSPPASMPTVSSTTTPTRPATKLPPPPLLLQPPAVGCSESQSTRVSFGHLPKGARAPHPLLESRAIAEATVAEANTCRVRKRDATISQLETAYFNRLAGRLADSGHSSPELTSSVHSSAAAAAAPATPTEYAQGAAPTADVMAQLRARLGSLPSAQEKKVFEMGAEMGAGGVSPSRAELSPIERRQHPLVFRRRLSPVEALDQSARRLSVIPEGMAEGSTLVVAPLALDTARLAPLPEGLAGESIMDGAAHPEPSTTASTADMGDGDDLSEDLKEEDSDVDVAAPQAGPPQDPLAPLAATAALDVTLDVRTSRAGGGGTTPCSTPCSTPADAARAPPAAPPAATSGTACAAAGAPVLASPASTLFVSATAAAMAREAEARVAEAHAAEVVMALGDGQLAEVAAIRVQSVFRGRASRTEKFEAARVQWRAYRRWKGEWEFAASIALTAQEEAVPVVMERRREADDLEARALALHKSATAGETAPAAVDEDWEGRDTAVGACMPRGTNPSAVDEDWEPATVDDEPTKVAAIVDKTAAKPKAAGWHTLRELRWLSLQRKSTYQSTDAPIAKAAEMAASQEVAAEMVVAEMAAAEQAEQAEAEPTAVPKSAISDPPSNEGFHPNVRCDCSGMHPIVGMRYHLRGQNYDLCQAEYDKLSAAVQAVYEAIPPPVSGKGGMLELYIIGGGLGHGSDAARAAEAAEAAAAAAVTAAEAAARAEDEAFHSANEVAVRRATSLMLATTARDKATVSDSVAAFAEVARAEVEVIRDALMGRRGQSQLYASLAAEQNRQGLDANQAGDFSRALTHFTQALVLQPRRASYVLSAANMMLKRTPPWAEQAIELYMQAKALPLTTKQAAMADTKLALALSYLGDQDVKMLQLFLNEVMGQQLVTPDGVYGPRTRQAVLEFESRFCMPLGTDLTEQLRTVRSLLSPSKGAGQGAGGSALVSAPEGAGQAIPYVLGGIGLPRTKHRTCSLDFNVLDLLQYAQYGAIQREEVWQRQDVNSRWTRMCAGFTWAN